MNYLAHAYLSFHHPDILVGNMISDFVKGKKQFDYPPAVQKGIRLHRAIDTFTDLHPATKQAKEYFKPAVGPYAGAFMDVVYDHFLALDHLQFSENALNVFAQEVYTQLVEREALLPERFARMLPYMSSQNWLYNYQFKEGIEKSFGGVVRRAQYLTDSSQVYVLFLKHYDSLKEHYKEFFPDVKNFASSQFDALLRQ
ncbi:MAG: ACP phosphodiesterase [Bacteroidota bacterium]